MLMGLLGRDDIHECGEASLGFPASFSLEKKDIFINVQQIITIVG
jgi:hypothetical protein